MAVQDGSKRPGVNATGHSWLELAQIIGPELELERELERREAHFRRHPWKHKLLPRCQGMALLPIGAGHDKKIPVNPDTGRGLKGWPQLRFSPDELALPNDSVVAFAMRPGPESLDIAVLDVDGERCMQVLERFGCRWEDLGWQVARDTNQNRRKVPFPVTPEIRELFFKSDGTPIGKKTRTEVKANPKENREGQQFELFFGTGCCIIGGKHYKSGGNYYWVGGPETMGPLPPAWLEFIKLLIAGKRKRRASSTAQLKRNEDLGIQWDAFRWSEEDKQAAQTFKVRFSAEQLLSFVPMETKQLICLGSPPGQRWDDGFPLTRDLKGVVNVMAELGIDINPQAEELLERYADNCDAHGKDIDRQKLQEQWEVQSEDRMPGRNVEDFLSSLWFETGGQLGKPKQQALKREQRKPGDEELAGVPGLLTDIGGGVWEEDENGAPIQPPRLEPGIFAQLVEQQLGSALRWNDLYMQLEYKGEVIPPDIAELLYVDLCKQDRYVSQQTAIDVVVRESKRYRYDPVLDYLTYLEQAKEINPVDINRLATTYLGTKDPLYDRMLKVMVIGAVTRRFEPGCKFDYVVVLKGEQGIRKSTFWQVLASPDWFTCSVPDQEKDLILTIHSTWVYELAELESITSKKDVGRMKNQITTTTDLVRLPYGRAVERKPRSSVFVSTVNGDAFLRDATGERRYLVIECPHNPTAGEFIDLEQLRRDRDRIWRAAVLAYKAGEKPYLALEDQIESDDRNEDFQVEHPWGHLLDEWLRPKNKTELSLNGKSWRYTAPEKFTTTQALIGCKAREEGSLKPADTKTMAELLRKRGYKQTKNAIHVDGNRDRFWAKAD